MKILLSTYGVRGDIAPYVCIARALQQLGAHPVIATAGAWQNLVESAGIEWKYCPPQAPTGVDLSRVMEAARGDERLFRQWIVPVLRESYEALNSLAADADVLVTHTLSFAGPIVAARRGLPWVSSAVSPLALLEPQLAPALPVAPWAAELPGFNRLLLRLLRRQFGAWLRPVQTLRRELNLPPGDNAIWHDAHSPRLALRLWSPLFGAPGHKGNARATGFCFAEAPATQKLAPDVASWIEKGEAPLVFCAASGCGGAGWEERARESARGLGRRAIILGAATDQTCSATLARRFAPLDALLPQAAALVHGGGIGALALGWHAGVPMLLTPRAHDQFDNARRARNLGIARTAKGNWTRDLEALLNDETLLTRAKESGALFAREEGARAAALAIMGAARERSF